MPLQTYLSNREQPWRGFSAASTPKMGVYRRAFTRNLIWEFSPLLISAERGDLQDESTEITEEEANQIVERIRAKVTGTSQG